MFTNRKPHAGIRYVTNRSGWNGNKAIAGAASEAFARWWHHQYAPVELPSAGAYWFAMRCLVS